MHRLIAAALAVATAATAAPVLAQTPPATIGERYVPAPWWMREPVIASIGQVRTQVAANRSNFSASFQSVDRTAADASRKAADQVRALGQALADYGVEVVRVETTLSTRPLYDQYRDENGVLRDNARSDQIERYQADATISVTVRNTRVLERVYATVVASRPTSIGQVSFHLEPDNALKTWLQGEAVKDAARRAREAAGNAGATLGEVKVIDPTGRGCETDVLAGWPSYGSGGLATDVDASDIVVTASRMGGPPPPPPPAPGMAPSEAEIESARLALQPPLRELTDRACVVYALD
ncbi:MAG: SIMPL domain-containing protein [Brevundimonas sp.]|uniref:SIMPL domain-containing protein n=1 Tax=Brevundimonas sp. TaxID=1871086 RepID=UPI00391A35F0